MCSESFLYFLFPQQVLEVNKLIIPSINYSPRLAWHTQHMRRWLKDSTKIDRKYFDQVFIWYIHKSIKPFQCFLNFTKIVVATNNSTLCQLPITCLRIKEWEKKTRTKLFWILMKKILFRLLRKSPSTT